MKDEVMRLATYLMKIECRFCCFEVYPEEEFALEEAKFLLENYKNFQGAIDEADHVCSQCKHTLDKDD